MTQPIKQLYPEPVHHMLQRILLQSRTLHSTHSQSAGRGSKRELEMIGCDNLNLMSAMRYRISSVSSEHPRYPAANLLNGDQGWQSAINCSYPQAITIQFFVPIRTKKVQLLFHQYKIPRLVEVFVKLGSQQRYRKLGFVSPNDNSQSSFQEHEEKTLYFEFSCTHIRLVLHENHRNDMNIFNQVALNELAVQGEILSAQEVQGIDLTEVSSEEEEDEVSESVEIAHNLRSVEEHAGSPTSEPLPLFRDIYGKLEMEKEMAVEREDYQRAAHLKTVITNFKTLENEMLRLQIEKQEALANEDYDKCHRIKQQISKKKEVIQFQKEDLFKNDQQFYSVHAHSRITEQPPPYEPKRKEETRRKEEPKEFKSPDLPSKFKNVSNLHDDQVVPALLNKGKPSQDLPLETNEKRRDNPMDLNQSIIPEGNHEVDNTSIKRDLNDLRGLSDRQPQQSAGNESVRYQLNQLPPLDNKLRARVENYFTFIPERVWQYAEHKNWKGKKEAVEFLKEHISEIETKEQYMGALELTARIIVAKQAAVTNTVLECLSRIADLNIKFSLQHLPFFMEDIINELLNLLNDTNQKTRELAYTTYLQLPKISFLSIAVPIRQLIRHKSKVKNDPKLIIIKLNLMEVITNRYPQFEQNAKEILNWALVFMEDPNQKVRNDANELLTHLAAILGYERATQLIATNKQHLLQLFLNLLNHSSLEHSKLDHSKLDHSKLSAIDHSKPSLQHSKLQQEFYGPIEHPSKQSLSQLSDKPIYVLEEKPATNNKLQHSKNSRRQNENMNIDLSYSKQSIFQESVEPSHITPSEQGIRVIESTREICEYCDESFEVERDHFLQECKVLITCEHCNSLIYLREFTPHLLSECEGLYRQCKRCGLAFEHSEINEHMGKEMCRKKLGLNWERCQFCGMDVLGEDRFWLNHAKECDSLPLKNAHKEEQNEYEDSVEG